MTDLLRVVRRIGVGGQGEVYEVEDTTGRRSAVKLLLASLQSDRMFVARAMGGGSLRWAIEISPLI